MSDRVHQIRATDLSSLILHLEAVSQLLADFWMYLPKFEYLERIFLAVRVSNLKHHTKSTLAEAFSDGVAVVYSVARIKRTSLNHDTRRLVDMENKLTVAHENDITLFECGFLACVDESGVLCTLVLDIPLSILAS